MAESPNPPMRIKTVSLVTQLSNCLNFSSRDAFYRRQDIMMVIRVTRFAKTVVVIATLA